MLFLVQIHNKSDDPIGKCRSSLMLYVSLQRKECGCISFAESKRIPFVSIRYLLFGHFTSTRLTKEVMVLMITYDLNKVKDYQKLYRAIGALGETKRDTNLDSVWFVSTSYTPVQASEHIRSATDGDDTHFICKIRSGERAGWMNKDVWDWINSHE